MDMLIIDAIRFRFKEIFSNEVLSKIENPALKESISRITNSCMVTAIDNVAELEEKNLLLAYVADRKKRE